MLTESHQRGELDIFPDSRVPRDLGVHRPVLAEHCRHRLQHRNVYAAAAFGHGDPGQASGFSGCSGKKNKIRFNFRLYFYFYFDFDFDFIFIFSFILYSSLFKFYVSLFVFILCNCMTLQSFWLP